MQGQEQELNVNYVIKEYQSKVADLTNENVALHAYVKQLKAEIEKLEERSAELDKK